MIRELADGRIVQMVQKKSDPSIKVAYVSKKGENLQIAFTGTMEGLRKWLDHQIKLADKAYARNLIADMCGTSYSAMRRDMGYSS